MQYMTRLQEKRFFSTVAYIGLIDWMYVSQSAQWQAQWIIKTKL